MESAFGYDITNSHTDTRANDSNGGVGEESPQTDRFPKGLDTITVCKGNISTKMFPKHVFVLYGYSLMTLYIM